MLWINPLLSYCQRYFRADLEDICDKVCIQNSRKSAQEYGWLLVETLKLLRSEQERISSVATYAGETDFQEIKKRIEKILCFQRYHRPQCRIAALAVAVLLLITIMGINHISYARSNELDAISVCEYDPQSGETVILDSSDRIKTMISYDDAYVYVDRAAFEIFLSEHDVGEDMYVYIGFGGYQKLPGVGGGGNVCPYQAGTNDSVVQIPYEKTKDNWMTLLLKAI